MSAVPPDLRALAFPQLVEDRKRPDSQHADGDLAHVYYATNSSSSDFGSPVTPTFSARHHLRCSSSVSSLDLPATSTDWPPSPSHQAHSIKSCKRKLPDVEEEPGERDDVDVIDGLYDCLCDEPFCIHRSAPNMIDRPVVGEFDFDYDLGFLSEVDLSGSRGRRNHRATASVESTLSGISSRIGSRLPSFNRWKVSRKNSIAALSVSPSCDTSPPFSYASSRSSSISSPLRPNYPHNSDSTISASPRHSFWDSTESLELPTTVETDHCTSMRDMERDRRLAATPLLPPLVTDSGTFTRESLSQEYPVSPVGDDRPSQAAPRAHSRAPSLMTKASVASFRPPPTSPELPIPFPNMLNDDEWSDRLGHANFTILPTPYQPEDVSLATLKKLRADWDLARVNYTKHLFRTGENYGETSKIYALTQQKWTEVEQAWKRTHDDAMERVLRTSSTPHPRVPVARSTSRGRGRGRAGSSAATFGHIPAQDVFAGMEWRRIEESGPATLPRMTSEDKFPSRGDEDIVGPMVREEAMVRACSADGRGARLWRNLLDKVGGLRR